jgi:hypothetical protein
MADAKKPGATINIKKPKKGEQIRVREVSQYSETWAEVVRPLTIALFTILAAVLLIPFLFVFVADPHVRTAAMDWAKTILAPTVGFASAAIGYYYGTRTTTARDDPPSDEDEPPGDDEPTE